MLGSCCGEAAPQRGDRPAADARVDDFQDVDTRLSFHLATPVLDVIGWPLQNVGRSSDDRREIRFPSMTTSSLRRWHPRCTDRPNFAPKIRLAGPLPESLRDRTLRERSAD